MHTSMVAVRQNYRLRELSKRDQRVVPTRLRLLSWACGCVAMSGGVAWCTCDLEGGGSKLLACVRRRVASTSKCDLQPHMCVQDF